MASNARTSLKVVGGRKALVAADTQEAVETGIEEELGKTAGEAAVAPPQRARKTRPTSRSARKPKAGSRSEGRAGSPDPVRVYLRDMGQVSLLTREGEVEIAKRIEAGVIAQESSVVGSNSGLATVIELGEKLRAGEIELGDAIDLLEGDDAPPVARSRARFLRAVGRVIELEPEILRRRRSIANSRTKEKTRDRLRGEINVLVREAIDRLRDARMAKRRIEEIKTCLEEAHESFVIMDDRVAALASAFGVDGGDFAELAERAGKRSARGKETLAQLGGNLAAIELVASEVTEIEKLRNALSSSLRMKPEQVDS
ncbi:MAG: sigma-70 factor domain-containing protein, partial [Myxococcota bacterium]